MWHSYKRFVFGVTFTPTAMVPAATDLHRTGTLGLRKPTQIVDESISPTFPAPLLAKLRSTCSSKGSTSNEILCGYISAKQTKARTCSLSLRVDASQSKVQEGSASGWFSPITALSAIRESIRDRVLPTLGLLSHPLCLSKQLCYVT